MRFKYLLFIHALLLLSGSPGRGQDRIRIGDAPDRDILWLNQDKALDLFSRDLPRNQNFDRLEKSCIERSTDRHEVLQKPPVIRVNLMAIKNPTSYKIYYSLSSDDRHWVADSIRPYGRREYFRSEFKVLGIRTGGSFMRFTIGNGHDYMFYWNSDERRWKLYLDDDAPQNS
ncbi:MAG: hypothetical protein WCK63_18565, partial [Betaproteobacteria bacterium]